MDVDAAARMVLTDWNDGRIPYFTEPPERAADDHADAAIAASWAAEFEADQVWHLLHTRCPPCAVCFRQTLGATRWRSYGASWAALPC